MVKKPPSRIRYESSHPVVSARVDYETYRKLREMAMDEGESLASILKRCVKKQEGKWGGAYQKGFIDGKRAHQIWFYCNVCGEEVIIERKSNVHHDVIRYLRERGWGHRRCHEEMY